MDKVLYISSAGANLAMRAQQVHANNLANSSTPGFRRDFVSSLAVELQGDGLGSRVMPVARGLGSSFDAGIMQTTGRNLDVAINGDGWLSVETAAGTEAYTRSGQLQVTPDGQLVIAGGLPVVGEAGAIQLPEFQSIDIGIDGTITIIPPGEANEPVQVGRLKLVNPEPGELQKSADGLFVATAGDELDADPEVRLRTGYLESSNVNALNEMVSFLSLSRQFEAQMKIMKAAGDMASSGDRLVRDQ